MGFGGDPRIMFSFSKDQVAVAEIFAVEQGVFFDCIRKNLGIQR